MMCRYKRVPAIDKCFAISICLPDQRTDGHKRHIRKLDLNKSTVFNTVHTLKDLNVLENQPDGKLASAHRFYVLAKHAGNRSELIQTAHPYLEMINEKTEAFGLLGIRSDHRALIIDKLIRPTGEGIVGKSHADAGSWRAPHQGDAFAAHR